jgi:hypothetical protein
MKLKTPYLIGLLFCLSALVAFAQSDALSGTWSGDWGPSATHRNPVTVQLKWDGKVLAGTVNPGPNAITLQKTSFDPKTGTVHMEAEAQGRGGAKAYFIIDGKLENGALSGSWNHDNRKGDFKISKK